MALIRGITGGDGTNIVSIAFMDNTQASVTLEGLGQWAAANPQGTLADAEAAALQALGTSWPGAPPFTLSQVQSADGQPLLALQVRPRVGQPLDVYAHVVSINPPAGGIHVVPAWQPVHTEWWA